MFINHFLMKINLGNFSCQVFVIVLFCFLKDSIQNQYSLNVFHLSNCHAYHWAIQAHTIIETTSCYSGICFLTAPKISVGDCYVELSHAYIHTRLLAHTQRIAIVSWRLSARCVRYFSNFAIHHSSSQCEDGENVASRGWLGIASCFFVTWIWLLGCFCALQLFTINGWSVRSSFLEQPRVQRVCLHFRVTA